MRLMRRGLYSVVGFAVLMVALALALIKVTSEWSANKCLAAFDYFEKG